MSDFVITSTTNSDDEVLAAAGGGTAKNEPIVEEKAPITTVAEIEEDEDDEAPQPLKKKGGFQKRIDKLTTRNNELEARLAKLENPEKAPAAPVVEEAPDPLFFETQAEYNAAVIAFEVKKATSKLREELKAESTQSAARQTEETGVTAWQAKVQAAHAAHPDLAELLEENLPMSPAMNAALMESEVGSELLYFLASNPAEVERISKLSPVAAVKAIDKIEATLQPAEETPVEKVKVTSAKKPISPVSGGKGSAGTKSPDDMDMNEYRHWRETQS